MPKKAAGAACGAPGECANGLCVDGYCCNSGCTGLCEACDVIGSAGQCSPVVGEVHGTRAKCVDAGKEWWAGEAWGLGLAGGFTYFSAKEKDILSGVLDSNESWSGPSYALRFSATFN